MWSVSLPHTLHVRRCCRRLCRSIASHHAPAASCTSRLLTLLTGSTSGTSCWLQVFIDDKIRNMIRKLWIFALRQSNWWRLKQSKPSWMSSNHKCKLSRFTFQGTCGKKQQINGAWSHRGEGCEDVRVITGIPGFFCCPTLPSSQLETLSFLNKWLLWQFASGLYCRIIWPN